MKRQCECGMALLMNPAHICEKHRLPERGEIMREFGKWGTESKDRLEQLYAGMIYSFTYQLEELLAEGENDVLEKCDILNITLAQIIHKMHQLCSTNILVTVLFAQMFQKTLPELARSTSATPVLH